MTAKRRFKRLFIFDIDGTLVDAYSAIHLTLNRVLGMLGYPEAGYKKVKMTVGTGNRSFIYEFFRKEDASRAIELFRKYHPGYLAEHVRLKDGAIKVLKELKARGKLLAVATNRPAYSARIILDNTGILGIFDRYLTGEEVGRLKPDPAILYRLMSELGVSDKETVFIGDMDVDLKTAKSAGVDGVFITGGSSRRSSIDSIKPKTVIFKLPSLLRIFY